MMIKPITKKYRFVTLLIALIIYFTSPLFLREYYLFLLTNITITFIIVQGLNIIVGYTGLFSFGQAGFVAFGAYFGAIISQKIPWLPFPIIIIITCIASMILGIIIGFPCLRLRKFYLAMITFAFAGAIIEIINYWEPLTGGLAGIYVPVPSIGLFKIDSIIKIFYLCAIIAILCQIVVTNIIKTKTGRAWIAVRDDEIASSSMGINVNKYKLLSFASGSLLGGLGGILYAYLFGFINASYFSFNMAINFFLALFIGGIATTAGPILGSFIMIILPQLIGQYFSGYLILVYGIILILIIILLPKGIIGTSMELSLKKRIFNIQK